ncbi:Cell wall mannoprotein PIR3 [Zalerion maritima]|uniref:Cell wall mannoprotein PIR3 n=1 Tax=Zalerion maritima TaxID=339359 RepID=A0AAD5WNH7_9PEZI|nr:Cell wall mannoprotein PIR3 [Zalerion maritima]
MKAAFALSLAGAVMALPQDVKPRDDCSSSYDGTFQVAVVSSDEMTKRGIAEVQHANQSCMHTVVERGTLAPNRLAKRSTCSEESLLEMTLYDGVLSDAENRTGYIASNYQFQFDDPPQTNALATDGFSVCGSSLALDSSTVWYQCLSGDFYNLYTDDWAEQCESIGLVLLDCDGTAASGDDVIVDTDVALPICQIEDGQIQAHTTPCVTATATAGVTTTYEVSSPAVTTAETTPVVTTAPTTVVSGSANTTIATPTISSTETTGETTAATVAPSASGTGTSDSTRLDGSVGALIIGLMATFLCL